MPKRKHSIDRLTIKHFIEVSKRYPRQYYLSWLTSVSAVGVTIVVPYFIGKILGSLADPNINPEPYIYGLVIASLISFALNRIAFKAFLGMQPKVMAYLQTEVLDALLKRGTSFHNNRVSGKLVSDASDYPSAYSGLSTTFFTEIMPFILIVVLGITLVAINSPIIGLVILLMTILAVGSGVYFRIRMTPFRLHRHETSKVMIAHVADTIVNNQAVKSFGNEADEMARHKKLNDANMEARLHDWMEHARDGSNRILGLLLFQVAFILIVVHQVRENPALLSTGIFAFSYTMTLSNRLFQIGTMMRSVEESLLLAMPMTEMLQERVEIADKPGAKDLLVREGGIEFRNVSFHYQDNPKNDKVFNDLNLHIQPGEKIGLVGPSGGGKSTLTKLLLRFEDVQGGAILIDNQEIASVTQTSLRKSIAYVPQEPLLFHRTIKENIAYGKPNASDTDIEQAAQKAHAHEFITTLPNGYDTVVGERGVKLSGGQRQRIAIARAILINAPILLLDEATSALDSESEVAIQAALRDLMQNRTAVVVAHRLSTIQRLDRIVVLNDGKILEDGSHAELLKANGMYAKLWKHQSGGFIED